MFVGEGAYHGEIGREATAVGTNTSTFLEAYHGEIGREATANSMDGREDYEIGKLLLN